MISLTERAVGRALKMAEKQGVAKILRVGVKGGGCSGMSYFMDFDEKIGENDEILELGELKVICDPKSLRFLENTELDFETNLLNHGFRFNNPNAKRSCSCGESFAI